MKRKTKIMISALSAMLVMVLAVTVVSFSLAGRNDKSNEGQNAGSNYVADSTTKLTIVDRIIDISNNGEEAEKTYVISEIGSTKKPSNVKLPGGSNGSYMELLATEVSGVSPFKTYVIDGNKSLAQSDTMAPKCVKYTYYYVGDITAADIEAISNSDLVYVSNDPNNMYTAGSNDISEDLYSALLHNYINNKKRPFIIDSPIETEKLKNEGNKKAYTIARLASDVFSAKGSRYYTFAWNTAKNAATVAGAKDFFQHKNGSLYLGINGDNKSANWTSVKRTGSDTAFNMAKVLTICTTADNNYKNNTLTNGAFADLDTCNKDGVETVVNADDDTYNYEAYMLYGTDAQGERIESNFYKYGYNSRYNSKPDMVTFEEVSLADINANPDKYNLDDYDMVILEKGIGATTITADLYKKFTAAMVGNVSIIYDSSLATTASTGDDPSFDEDASKYNMLFSMIASAKGVSKKSNVMVTDTDSFGVIATSNSASTCKKIADLINASAFRVYGGANSAANTFTVLEIQPCYPIDLKLAESIKYKPANSSSAQGYRNQWDQNRNALKIKGAYYTIPAVVSNEPKEEISSIKVNSDGTTSIETPEYYAWELSDAKIADALGRDINEVKVVHMSSEELAASTVDIMGTYDMIYIGGNKSALRSAEQWQELNGITGAGAAENYTTMKALLNNGDIKYLPIYAMYTHNGDLTDISVASTGYSGSVAKSGNPYANVEINGTKVASFGTLNGNDVTYKVGQQLIDYVDAGLPVIVSDDAAEGYEAIINANDGNGNKNPYLQNSIDPDCNMAAVLAECYAMKSGGSNVLWKFDKDAVYHGDNAGGALGQTNIGYVELFASNDAANPSVNIDNPDVTVNGQKEDIYDVYDNSIKKPKVLIKKTPERYDDTKENSGIATTSLEFEYEIEGNASDYTVTVWVDDDGNGRFGDATDKSAEGDTTSASFGLPDGFFGPVSWQLLIEDVNTGTKTSITGLSYILNTETPEVQTVKVLQIMPGNKTANRYSKILGEGCDGTTATNSLYFCTVCQQAYGVCYYNPITNNGSTHATYYLGNYADSWNDILDYSTGATLGKHEHIFGIPYYDASLPIPDGTMDANGGKVSAKYREENPGMDNWKVNLADDINDRFDIKIDILHKYEVEAISDEVRKAYNFKVLSKAQQAALVQNFEKTVDLKSKEFEDYNNIDADDIEAKLTYITQYNFETYASEYYNLYDYMRSEKAVPDNAEEVGDSTEDDDTTEAATTDGGEGAQAEQNKDFVDPITGATIQITKTTVDAKTDLNKVISEICTELRKKPGNMFMGQLSNGALADELEYLVEKERYFDIFNIIDGNSQLMRYNYNNLNNYMTAESKANNKTFMTYFKEYVTCKDLELEYLEKYKEYDRKAHASNWIEGCYNTVIIGPSDDFAGDDFTKGSNGLKDLTNYVKNGGNVLLFHDTLTRFDADGAVNLTTAIRSYVGQDKNHMKAVDTSNSYVKYTSEDEDKYKMTNLSYKLNDDNSKYASWTADMRKYQHTDNSLSKKLSAIAYTDAIAASNQSSNPNGIAYKYAGLSWSYAAFYAAYASRDARLLKNNGYGTDRAKKNNDGLITLYPFMLSEDIYISGTHPQAYALDLEDDRCTVWYSLAGGYNDPEGSSMFAASPKDGGDNYFIYSYNNVYYCGAGHSKITGIGKMNNDERKLYINIICNSVRKSVASPTIHLYDYDKDTYGDKIKRQDGNYFTKVDSTDAYPEFSFKAVVDPEATLANVKIFYDLDYSDTNKSNEYRNDKNHELIVSWNSPTVKSGERKNVYRYDQTLEPLLDASGKRVVDGVDEDENNLLATKLKLKQEYFDAYNGEYTYIVVVATDSKGNKVSVRLKVMLKDVLFNLT